MVGAVEAASFEDDWHGVNEAACLPCALGTNSYRLLIELLLPLKSRAATAALIFVDRQSLTSRKRRLFDETALFVLRELALTGKEC
jgi:hypothetical protein